MRNVLKEAVSEIVRRIRNLRNFVRFVRGHEQFCTHCGASFDCAPTVAHVPFCTKCWDERHVESYGW